MCEEERLSMLKLKDFCSTCNFQYSPRYSYRTSAILSRKYVVGFIQSRKSSEFSHCALAREGKKVYCFCFLVGLHFLGEWLYWISSHVGLPGFRRHFYTILIPPTSILPSPRGRDKQKCLFLLGNRQGGVRRRPGIV